MKGTLVPLCIANHLALKQSARSQNQPFVVIQMQQHGCISMRYVVTHKLQHDSVRSSECSEYLPRESRLCHMLP